MNGATAGNLTDGPHDPYPIKVRNKAGDWVTTLPMSALGYYMPHEVQRFAPDPQFCQQRDHYTTPRLPHPTTCTTYREVRQ